MARSFPYPYLGTKIDGVHLGAEQLLVRAQNLNDLLGKYTYTDALFHILHGELPTEKERRMFDLVLVAFHGGFGLLPPTTLVPRLVAGTGVSTAQALAAGYLASGPYHVGAVEHAMTLYRDILTAFQAERGGQTATAGELTAFAREHVSGMIARGETVPGYGHPLLRKDPRPTHVRRVLCEMEADGPYLDVYDGVVGCMSDRKGVPPNVDGITGAILLTLGFLPQHGTGLFLLARTAAMLAHVVEEQTDMPYQTQKRFMILPVGMPRLFNANFKQLAKRFNKLRDNKSFQRIQSLFGAGAKKPFRAKEETDQAMINAARTTRDSQSLPPLPTSLNDPDTEDRFAASSKAVEVQHALDIDESGEAVEVSAEYFPELLAGASMCLATSLEQITPGENADVPAEQHRTAELLRQALKLVHEAAALETGKNAHPTGEDCRPNAD